MTASVDLVLSSTLKLLANTPPGREISGALACGPADLATVFGFAGRGGMRASLGQWVARCFADEETRPCPDRFNPEKTSRTTISSTAPRTRTSAITPKRIRFDFRSFIRGLVRSWLG